MSEYCTGSLWYAVPVHFGTPYRSILVRRLLLFGNAEYSDPDRDPERSESRSYRVWVRTIRNAKRGQFSVSCDFDLMVKTAVDGLRETAASKANRFEQEMSTMKDSSSCIRDEWTSYSKKAESHYVEDTAAVECGKKDLDEVLQNCLKKAKMGSQQWSSAQESLLSLEKSNVASVEEIVRGGLEANQSLRTRYSAAVSSAVDDTNVASKNLLSSIDYSLQLDHDARKNLDSIIAPCCGELRELKGGHYHKIIEITENAGKTLLNDYTVDEPSCTTPKKRPFNLPSMASIEELQTPSFEELLKCFWDSKSSLKLQNGDIKHLEAATHSPRDSRPPLTAIN